VDVEYDDSARKQTRQKPSISKIVTEGDSILVQVSKEPVYEKGAKMTTCFTLPGRFFVLMPNIPRLGVSKKIDDRDERIRLKDIIKSALPEGMGGIIRTTSESRDQDELIKDVRFLLETWETIQSRLATAKPQEKIYEDIPLSFQVGRDCLDGDVEAVITDDKKSQAELYKFVRTIAPEHAMKIMLYDDIIPIFQQYDIEKQIEQALDKKVHLRSGGSLIIESTEAMTVVDVNTGRFTGKANLEDTILKTNLEAAEEIARQLRLRNIGGLIVIDFIDMATSTNRQKLFNVFEKTLKEHDRFQSVVLKVSEFGLVQMTRKRSGKTLMQQLMQDCKACHGLGVVKSLQSDSFAILRAIEEVLSKGDHGKEISVGLHPSVFEYLSSIEYNAILDLEKQFKIKIALETNPSLYLAQYKIKTI
jgi:ribonuclease G